MTARPMTCHSKTRWGDDVAVLGPRHVILCHLLYLQAVPEYLRKFRKMLHHAVIDIDDRAV